MAPPSEPPSPADERVDLATLVNQFTALRHEVNLLTKAARTQQEQTGESLRQLGLAVECAQQPPQPTEEEILRPVLKALIDVHDNLSLASRAVQKVQGSILAALDQTDLGPEALGEPKAPIAESRPSLPFWARWLGLEQQVRQQMSDTAQQVAEIAQAEVSRQRQHLAKQQESRGAAAVRVRQLIEATVTGYTMSLQRLERALQQLGLEMIPTENKPFDPDLMEAVDVIAANGRGDGVVVDELRRGYRWRGQIFRCAQVRVTKE
jgi:molecular chaperone GrpE